MNFATLFTRRNIALTLVFLLVLGALGYYFVQYQRLAAAEPQAKSATEQSAKIIGEIKKLIYIADDSGAQIAEITDVSKLAGQPFFVRAQNHDYLALFPLEKKAILYRPSDKKIIEVGPFDPRAASSSSSR